MPGPRPEPMPEPMPVAADQRPPMRPQPPAFLEPVSAEPGPAESLLGEPVHVEPVNAAPDVPPAPPPPAEPHPDELAMPDLEEELAALLNIDRPALRELEAEAAHPRRPMQPPPERR